MSRTALRTSLVVLAFGCATPLAADPPVVLGFARLAGGSLDAAPSFLAGGFGKLADGGQPDDPRADAATAEARFALDWEPALGWRLFVHGVARDERASASGAAGSGILEAFAERRSGFGAGHEIVVRAGQFFLPTSRENSGPLWSSPYTLTLSAMNSWVAEEIRPIGLDLSWRRSFSNEHRLELAGTLFGGNDSSGTLLAWRGFSFHDRPTPTGRFVPLPQFPARASGFPDQSPAGSQAFGNDLDGRPGWAGRATWRAPGERALVQATIFRNEGDRGLHGDEYAWDTDFRWLGAEVTLAPGLVVLGEWGTGTSAMGFAPPGGRSPAQVDILYDALYLLASYESGRLRFSVRFDDFRVEDRDSNPLDANDEQGRAWTLALLATLGEQWRIGVEYLSLDAQRSAAHQAGSPGVDADAFRVELRRALF